MKPPSYFPSLTTEWHNASYDAISPTQPSLSVANKTVVITGAGRGIGAEAVRAFAMAGAARIALIGRTVATLSQTRATVAAEYPSLPLSIHIADVADEAAMKEVVETIGAWDVLILNAGQAGKPGPIADAKPEEWWRIFETNVKGAMVVSNAFLPYRKSNAAIVGVNANLITTSPKHPPTLGASAYNCSKLAQAKLLEHLAAENPDLYVVSVHPGVVETDMLAEMTGGSDFTLDRSIMDDIKLPAHFFVWVVSSEARFLNGKFVCANWDVEELKGKANEIETTPILTANIHGWPY